jgi:hypothetical protein
MKRLAKTDDHRIEKIDINSAAGGKLPSWRRQSKCALKPPQVPYARSHAGRVLVTLPSRGSLSPSGMSLVQSTSFWTLKEAGSLTKDRVNQSLSLNSAPPTLSTHYIIDLFYSLHLKHISYSDYACLCPPLSLNRHGCDVPW